MDGRDRRTSRLIAGYVVFRFGVAMTQNQYLNLPSTSTFTVSPAVLGAQYRITVWALGNGSRSASPAVEYVPTREAGELQLVSSVEYYGSEMYDTTSISTTIHTYNMMHASHTYSSYTHM